MYFNFFFRSFIKYPLTFCTEGKEKVGSKQSKKIEDFGDVVRLSKVDCQVTRSRL